MSKQVSDVKTIAADTAKQTMKDIEAGIATLAKTKSDGGVLREVMARALGAGAAAARLELDGWTFYPIWDKTFCPSFYNEDSGRSRPDITDKGDAFGIAATRFGELGAHALYPVADRYRIGEFVLDIKGDSSGGYGIPRRGSFIAKVLKAHKEVPPTEKELKAIRAKEIKDANDRGKGSEFKTRAANLVKGMVSLAVAADIDAVLKEYPEIAGPFNKARLAVEEFGKRTELHFKAKADATAAAKKAAKAGKPSKASKTGMTHAERNKAASDKFAAIAALAAKGSNGKATKAGATKH